MPQVPGTVISPSARDQGPPRTADAKWATLQPGAPPGASTTHPPPGTKAPQARGRTLGTQNRRPPRCLAFPGSSLSRLSCAKSLISCSGSSEVRTGLFIRPKITSPFPSHRRIPLSSASASASDTQADCLRWSRSGTAISSSLRHVRQCPCVSFGPLCAPPAPPASRLASRAILAMGSSESSLEAARPRPLG